MKHLQMRIQELQSIKEKYPDKNLEDKIKKNVVLTVNHIKTE